MKIPRLPIPPLNIPRRTRDRIAAGVFSTLVVLTAISFAWTLRQAWAVYKLRRGVGDTWFLAADGRPWFRMDERRQDVSLADIPADLQHAFVAVEDHRFYKHLGIDPIALGRAVVRDVRSGGAVEGGSTLTQQLARTLFLSNQKSYGRKAREAVLALMIDSQLTKQQILELYLNRIYLSGGVYGVETMSRHLFNRPARTLNLAECALVAGLARAPSSLSPWTNLDGAIERSHVVLQRMREEGFITDAQERAARATRIRIAPYPGPTDPRGGYAKEFLRQQFRDQFGGDHPPDWQVRTTFIPELQDMAERAVADTLRRFNQPDLQAALIAIDPRTGDIRARRRPGLPPVAVQPGRPQPPATRLGVQAVPLCRCTGARVFARVAAQRPGEHRAARARRMGAAQRDRRDTRRADASRSPRRIEQPRRDRAAAAGRFKAGASARVHGRDA